MTDFTTAAMIMTGVALFFGVVLAVAYRFLRVEEDPRIDIVEELLPGSNCGACGEPGCRAFAEKLCLGTTQPGKCTVNSADGIDEIASFLGVDAGAQEKRTARLHCAGGLSQVKRLAEYDGLDSCRAAVQVNAGGIACGWGCLGLADCAIVCTFDAIKMTEGLLPKVDTNKCTACNDCVDVCPRDLFTLELLSHPVVVQCASPLAGETATSICTVACDACGRCALDAGDDVIEMSNGLPKVNLPDRTTIECTFRCPTGAIQWVRGDQFEDES